MAKTSSQVGGRFIRDERNAIERRNTDSIYEAVRCASQKWGSNRRFDMLHPITDRIHIGVLAVLHNWPKVKYAENPAALAYTIAYRAIGKTFRKDTNSFGRLRHMQVLVPEGMVAEDAYDSLGASGSKFEKQARTTWNGSSAVAWCQWVANEREAASDHVMEQAAKQLPTALAQLSEIERRAIELYYYFDLTAKDIAVELDIPQRRVYWLLEQATCKLHLFLTAVLSRN